MQPIPNSPYRLKRRANRNRFVEILTVSLFAIAFMLLGMGATFWIIRSQGTFGPTPTPTATQEPIATETPNVPATVAMEDMLTQVAYTAAQATLAFQALGVNQTATAEALLAAAQPQSPLAAETNVVLLPSISAGGEQPTDPAAQPAGEQPTSVAMLPIISAPQGESPLATPTETLLPGITVVETPTETPTLLPTETPTFTPEPPTATATATLFTVTNLTSRVVSEGGAPLYPGIGSVYTAAVTKPKEDTSLRLQGRSETGEWLNVSDNGALYWTRYAFVRPQGNAVPQGAPSGSVGDDVRWLPVVGVTTNPQPAATPVQALPAFDEYSQYLHDLNNSGMVTQLPGSYLSFDRLGGSEAGGTYYAPLMVVGDKIYAANGDRKLYAIGKTDGTQRWVIDIGDEVRQSPTVVGANIYLATQNGTIVSIIDQGNSAAQQWTRPIPNSSPITAIKTVGNKLFVGMNEAGINKLYVIDRNNGSLIKNRAINGTMLAPAIAGNTIYVAGQQLLALDVDNIDITLWQLNPNSGVTTPPVFVYPGQKAIAELVFADGGGQIHVLNAHTGEDKMQLNGVAGAKFINVTTDYIVATGEGFVRIFARNDGHQIYNLSIGGGVITALASGSRLLVVQGDGQILLINLATGQQVPFAQRPVSLLAAPAVSSLDLFIPGSDRFIYVVRGGQ